VAALARLEVEETGLDALAADMGRILGLAERLRDSDDGGERVTEPSASFRDDVEAPCLGDATAQAPEARGGFFRVPTVIEKR
jgi:aspartyl/glutamyl-tRNA(Asn/Gln) amidotransferase C subunit